MISAAKSAKYLLMLCRIGINLGRRLDGLDDEALCRTVMHRNEDESLSPSKESLDPDNLGDSSAYIPPVFP